jgi:hypothetical protein
MPTQVRNLLATAAVLASLAVAGSLAAQSRVTTPKEFFGFNLGDDYHVASYQQISEYWKKLDRESDRMVLQDIGKTAEGRPQYMAVITSPENHRTLARFKEISRKLALAEGLTDDEARALAAEGKAVVWIDGGLHATETVGSQQLSETVYMLVSANDREVQRMLDDVIVLCAHANPDGNDLVANWYMREPTPEKRSMAGLPRLYQKYVGHDNNRDFYMSNQPETENINRVLYLEWFPQIVYNHHQTGPAGTVLFAPPFRGPHNYNFDPMVPLGIDLVGAAMHNRFAVEGKAGATMRRGANYSTWYNGGLRTTTYFHNMIGLLTEIIGSPTPMEIPFRPERQLASEDLPFPIAPQKWHYRQSIDYSLTANRAVLDVASRHREQFLFNIYRMGRNSIERGSKDSWTTWPSRVDEVQQAIARERGGQQEGGAAPVVQMGGGTRAAAAPMKYFDGILRDPARRDPRGYVLPANQPDFPTATKFANALLKTGVTVHRATADFEVAGRRYPKGSFVVKTAQAFRPHVLDMFEPQDHPNDVPYPGGPPIPPYDNSGYTLAMTMGVVFDRVLDGFDGPFEKVSGLAAPLAGAVPAASPAGYLIDRRVNDAVIVVNRLLKDGDEVHVLAEAMDVGGTRFAPGTIYVGGGAGAHAVLERAARELGVSAVAAPVRPTGQMRKLRVPRIGLWDRYGGSMPSGWIRWLLERFEYPFEVVYPQTLDAGKLRPTFDVLIFPDGAIPEREGAPTEAFSEAQPAAESVPAEYRSRLGRVSLGTTVPHLKAFLAEGGSVLTIGRSTALAKHLGLPVESALAERQPDGSLKPLPRERFYIPGSVLRATVDGTREAAWGLGPEIDLFYDESPAFRLGPDAAAKGVHPVAWFATAKPLRSGWAWGQHYLEDAVAIVEARVGRGRLLLFGPEVTMRGQTHGTFKFLFNGIYGAAEEAPTARR